MSTGHVQHAIASAFEASPKAHFTTRELAALAYPGVPVERKHMVAVTRAIPTITPALTFCRVGNPSRPDFKRGLGWHHVWGRD